MFDKYLQKNKMPFDQLSLREVVVEDVEGRGVVGVRGRKVVVAPGRA